MSTDGTKDEFGTCPACDDPIRAELGNKNIPATWNYTCSPECGSYIQGVLDNAPDSPKAKAWAETKTRCQAICEANDTAQDECSHEWTDEHPNGLVTTIRSFSIVDGRPAFGEYTAKHCHKCGATTRGEKIR